MERRVSSLLICSCPLAQCRYFYITYRARAHVNPDPVYVCADVLLPKSREDRKSGLSFDDEERLFHVRSLAQTLASMYKDIQQIRDDAEKLHAQEKARQAELAQGREGPHAEELERARRSSITLRPGRVTGALLKKKLYDLQDKVKVPDAWEDWLPGAAAIVTNLENSIDMMEQELVSEYRKEDPEAQKLKFLCEACA